MKRFLFYSTLILMVGSLACKSATTEAPQEIPATIFTSMVAKFHVNDFNAWKSTFLSNDSMRMAYDVRTIGIAREMPDTNAVIVINRIGDVTRAKAFAASPELKTVMDQGGVAGPPEITYLHVLRNDTTTIPQRDRMMVSHHVKDFGAWLKVYDAEGVATRAGYGLIDRALGRGVEDSNMVYIVFAISDSEKAMARGSSEELKKLMEEAGVDSEPQRVMYTFDMLKE